MIERGWNESIRRDVNSTDASVHALVHRMSAPISVLGRVTGARVLLLEARGGQVQR